MIKSKTSNFFSCKIRTQITFITLINIKVINQIDKLTNSIMVNWVLTKRNQTIMLKKHPSLIPLFKIQKGLSTSSSNMKLLTKNRQTCLKISLKRNLIERNKPRKLISWSYFSRCKKLLFPNRKLNSRNNNLK